MTDKEAFKIAAKRLNDLSCCEWDLYEDTKKTTHLENALDFQKAIIILERFAKVMERIEKENLDES